MPALCVVTLIEGGRTENATLHQIAPGTYSCADLAAHFGLAGVTGFQVQRAPVKPYCVGGNSSYQLADGDVLVPIQPGNGDIPRCCNPRCCCGAVISSV